MENVKITVDKNAGRYEVRYISGNTIYVEELAGGSFVGRYWSADGNINSKAFWESDAFELRIKDKPAPADRQGMLLSTGWQWEESSEIPAAREGSTHFVIGLLNRKFPVKLKVHTLLDGTPILTRWLEITNNSAEPIALTAVSPWSGRLWDADAPITLGHAIKMTIQEANLRPFIADERNEGWFGWTALSSGTNVFEETKGLAFDKPYFVLRNEAKGEYFYGQLAWSTNYKMEFQKTDGLTFQIGPTAVNALRVLAPAETITTPAVHLGPVKGDFDATVQAMHEHIRRSVLPVRDPERSHLIQYLMPPDQPWSNYRFDECTEENMKKAIDVAAAAGCEVFILDGSQWCAVYCDWLVPNPKRFPRGLRPLVDYAHKKGLLFGLYIETEGSRDGGYGDCAGMGNYKETKLFQQHPNWFYPTRSILNLSIAEAAAYFEAEVARIIERHRLDLYRHDFCGVKLGQGSETLRDGFVECDYWRHYDAFHEAFTRIRAKHPDLILQQAAEGNARLDLSTVGVFYEHFTSDWGWYPYAYRMLSGLSVELPPEIYVHPNGMAASGNLPDLDTTLRCAYAAGNTAMIFNGLLPKNLEELKPETHDKCLHYANIYKTFIRPMLADCKVWHHAPVNETGGVETGYWFAIEFTSPDKQKGWATIVRLSEKAKAGGGYALKPRGLDAGKVYRVTFDNSGREETIDGSTLMKKGLVVDPLGDTCSELLMFKAAK